VAIPATYSGFFLMNATPSILKACEFSCMFVISLIGLRALYTLLEEERVDRFISDFVCLSFPVVNTLNVVIWGFFWVVNLFLSDEIIDIFYHVNYRTAVDLRGRFIELTIFLSNVVLEAAFFFWIYHLLNKTKHRGIVRET
jgi:hypothetical protein